MYENDIPMELAIAAHSGTSWTPERRAEQRRAEYSSTLAGDLDSLSKYATTEEKRAQLTEEFERYRAGYRRRYCAYLASLSRCVSSMITGPSGFNVQRAEKRNAVADRRWADLDGFRAAVLKAIRRALCPELAPIMASDADASERLDAKIAAAEKRQALMKAANAAIRAARVAGPEAQQAALEALGFSDVVARQLLRPDFAGRIGFADYQLTNNNGNIRRMKARLDQVEVAQATPDTSQDGTAARLDDCPADNRIRLFFPGKPGAEVRDLLKRNGFRWAPSLGCWQAYRNGKSLDVARRVSGGGATPSEKEDPHDLH